MILLNSLITKIKDFVSYETKCVHIQLEKNSTFDDAAGPVAIEGFLKMARTGEHCGAT